MILYHNPRCSKSRQALALLEEKHGTIAVRLYLDDVPTVDELLFMFKHYNGDSKDFVRSKEANEAGFDKNFEVNHLAHFLHQHPKALQRPILVDGNTVIIGRPPELVLK